MTALPTIIYKITRCDGLEYVGITTDIKRRIKDHRKTKRFYSGIKKIVILDRVFCYENALVKEAEYVTKFDTYRNGLNQTPSGGALSGTEKFNTYGMKYNEVSRQKMREAHEIREHYATGWSHDEEVKVRWSDKRKGKCWGPRSIDEGKTLEIYQSFESDSIDFSEEFISKYVKKTHKDMVGKVAIENLKSSNGKYLNKMTLYAYYFAEIYNVTPQRIRKILNDKGRASPSVHG